MRQVISDYRRNCNMDKVITFQVEEQDGTIIDWVKIDKGNDEAVWMPKSTYDTLVSESTATPPTE